MKRKTKSVSALTKLRKTVHSQRYLIANNQQRIDRLNTTVGTLQDRLNELRDKLKDMTEVRDKLLRAIVFTSMKDVHPDVSVKP